MRSKNRFPSGAREENLCARYRGWIHALVDAIFAEPKAPFPIADFVRRFQELARLDSDLPAADLFVGVARLDCKLAYMSYVGRERIGWPVGNIVTMYCSYM